MATRTPQEVFIDRLKTLIPEREGKAYAKRARISEQTLSKWRTGKIPANPKLETLCRLAEVFGRPVPYLISDEPAVSDEQRAEADAERPPVQGDLLEIAAGIRALADKLDAAQRRKSG